MIHTQDYKLIPIKTRATDGLCFYLIYHGQDIAYDARRGA